MFQIYNLVSIIKGDISTLDAFQNDFASLNDYISQNINDTFMSKKRTADADGDKAGLSKRNRNDGGKGGSGLQRGGDVYHDRKVIDTFTRAGYTLESNDEDENGWAPLNQVTQPNRLLTRTDAGTW